MATDKFSVRTLTSTEVATVCAGLELLAKSMDRAAKAASNPAVSDLMVKDAAMARNLINHFRSGTLDV